MNILYLVFGDTLRYHIEANLSIRTFQRQMTEKDRIIVFTNRPEYYRRAQVEVMTLTDEQMNEWRGKHQYLFRIKIMAVDYLHQQYPDDDLLFMDCDTFLYGRLDEMKSRIQSGAGLMHLCEGHPSKMKGRSRQMWNTMNGRTVRNITIGERHALWNSGVIGIPASKASQVISDWLALCDYMLDAGVEAFNLEEYALSIALLEHTQLMATDDHVGHYWGNKADWEQLVSDLMCKAYMKNQTVEEELAGLDIELLKQTPVYVDRSSRYGQLCRLADKLFPIRKKRCV